MSEEWRPWRDGAYEVSSFGRVRRAKPGRRTYVGRELRATRMTIGYLQVAPTINGRNVPTYVHEMVAECFLGPRPAGMEINHIDGDKGNAKVTNLEYVSHLENMRHASGAGLMAHGESHYAAKLTDAQVVALRADRARGASYSTLAKRFGIAISHAFNICRGTARRSA